MAVKVPKGLIFGSIISTTKNRCHIRNVYNLFGFLEGFKDTQLKLVTLKVYISENGVCVYIAAVCYSEWFHIVHVSATTGRVSRSNSMTESAVDVPTSL